jgi:hypothetical protein
MSVVAKCVAIRCRATLDLRVPVRPLTIWGTVKTAKASISSLLARLTIGVRIAWSRTGSVHPEGGTRPSSRLPHAARATNARVVRVTAPVARRASPHRRSPCIENHRRVQWHDRSGIPSNPRPSAPSRSNPDSVYPAFRADGDRYGSLVHHDHEQLGRRWRASAARSSPRQRAFDVPAVPVEAGSHGSACWSAMARESNGRPA